jgi:hypothetical protein
MDKAQRTLFGKFPRALGVTQDFGGLRQFVVHSEGEFDVFEDAVNGSRNAYASVSWRPVGGNIKLDKVTLDFDTPAKPDWPMFSGEKPPDDEIVARMRNDERIANDVLGEVLRDGSELAQRAKEDDVPLIGVFSGMGLHVHLLYQETHENLKKKLGTTARKYVGDLNLNTADPKVGLNGDQKKVVRLPNFERIEITDGGGTVRPCSVYTIPLTRDELAEGISPSEALEMARSPRRIDPEIDDSERPEMEVHDHYVSDFSEEQQEEKKEVQESVLDDDEDGQYLDFLLKEWLRMPCMYERIQQPEPDHRIRQNFAVMMFNLGFGKKEVHEIIQRIGWVDYDYETTKHQLDQIYRRGYSDMTCASLRQKGLCTVHEEGKEPETDDPKECPTYGWSGGCVEWK